MDRKIYGILGVIAIICVILFALFYMGIIHTGAFAIPGTTYGPGTYTIGTDLPAGEYNLDGPYDLKGSARFSASSKGGLSLSNKGVQIESGAVVTIHEGGNMTYVGS